MKATDGINLNNKIAKAGSEFKVIKVEVSAPEENYLYAVCTPIKLK